MLIKPLQDRSNSSVQISECLNALESALKVDISIPVLYIVYLICRVLTVLAYGLLATV